MISVSKLRSIVLSGGVIRWCGAVKAEELLVEVLMHGISVTYSVHVDSELSLVGANGVIRIR